MNDITKNELRSKLFDYVNSITQPTPKGGKNSYICPIPECGSGTGPNKTGAFFLDDKASFEKWKCFSCNAGGDIFDLAEKVNGLAKGQGMKYIESYYGNRSGSAPINPTSTRARENEKQPEKKEQTPPKDHTAEYKQWQANLSQTDYLTGRGFTPEIIKRFRLGYNPECWIGKNQVPAIIIPCTNNYYLRRPLDPKKAGTPKYLTMPSRKIEASCFMGIKHLAEASPDPVFIVEGAFDAISIEQAGAAAISINSQSNKRLFIEYMRANKPQRPLIAALDPDEQAQKSQSEIIAAAREMGVTAIGFNFSTETAKDPNDRLKQGLPTLQAAIETALLELDIKAKEAIAEEGEAERLKELEREALVKAKKVSEYMNAFLADVEGDNERSVIPTGFKQFDEMLGGGFMEGNLICLGALSSYGKSTLAAQIADQIAEQGYDVLFFCLEMPKRELVARSLSRLTYANAIDDSSLNLETYDILYFHRKNYSATDMQNKLNHLYACSDKYFGAVGNNLFYDEAVKPDFTPFSVIDIEREIKTHIDVTGNKPVVFVDYLQILAPPNDRASDTQAVTRNMTTLKRLAREHRIPVFVISAFNRSSYEKDVGRASFRDSSTIEYSSDILLGLKETRNEREACQKVVGYSKKGEEQEEFDIDKYTSKPLKEIGLKIIKNRNGMPGQRIIMNYNSQYNHFEEVINGVNNLFRKMADGGDGFNLNPAGKHRGVGII